MGRRVNRVKTGDINSLWYWSEIKHPLRLALNFFVIYLCRYIPSLRLKNTLYRVIGIKVGENVSVGLGTIFDIFFPEMISIGNNSIIGYGSVILGHEFLIEEYRVGKVEIGKNVMVGANCTLLPGISIGDKSTISACSLVNRDVPSNTMVGGVPINIIER